MGKEPDTSKVIVLVPKLGPSCEAVVIPARPAERMRC